MMSYEYLCPACRSTWSDIGDYPTLNCPKCDEADPIVTWRARTYD